MQEQVYKIQCEEKQVFQFNEQQYNEAITYLMKLSAQNKVQDITLGAILTKYAELYPCSQFNERFIYALKFFFGHSFRKVKLAESIQVISSYDFSTVKLKIATIKNYVLVLSKLYDFAIKEKYCALNPCNEIIIAPAEYTRLAALNAEKWIKLSEAQEELKELFIRMRSPMYSSWFSRNHYFYDVFLIHMLLATRISETYAVITQFDKEAESKHYMFIKTKTKDSFRIVLTNAVIILIKKVKDDFSTVTFASFKSGVSTALKALDLPLTAHGCRAIFRTVIELLPKTKHISFEAKEYYLAHDSKSVSRTYQRLDFFEERYKMQLEYAMFLLPLAGKDTKWVTADKFLKS